MAGSKDQLIKRIKELQRPAPYNELLRYVRRPGWTTPAEAVFALGILESMLRLQGELMRGARLVGK